jgi:L-fuculose-phosphate aldolase
MTTEPTTADVKQRLVRVAQDMLTSGLVQGTAGNVAARLPDGDVALTPSSLDYRAMGVDDLVVCDLDGNVVEGQRSPTSEKALHLTALREYPELNATMHCHAKFSTMFALTGRAIPAVIEEFVVYVGGDVPIASYRTTGTDELATEVASHLRDRSAVLMANHGLFAVGKDADDALHVAQLVERTAEIVAGASRLGEIVPLPEATRSTFAGYYRLARTGSF